MADPKIDAATLPDLETLTGMFGSAVDAAKFYASDDSVIVLMSFLYDIKKY